MLHEQEAMPPQTVIMKAKNGYVILLGDFSGKANGVGDSLGAVSQMSQYCPQYP